MGKPKRNITIPREKSVILKMFCNNEELDILSEYIKKGAVFIVLGSEYTDTREFYKGLYQLMYSPVANGACVYDSHYQFREANQRPYVTIALNDPVNVNHAIDSITLLGRYRNKRLYKVDYTVEEELEKSTKYEAASTVMSILGYRCITDTVGEKTTEYTYYNLNKLYNAMSEDNFKQLLENILLNRFLGGKQFNPSRVYVAANGDIQPLLLTDLFENEECTEQYKFNGRAVSFELRDKPSIELYNDVIKELGRRVYRNRGELVEYSNKISETGCFGYKCSRILNSSIRDVMQSVFSDTELLKEMIDESSGALK